MPVFFCPALSHEKTKARGHVDPHPSPLHMEAFQKLDATWRGHGETTTSSRRFQGGFFHPWFFTNLLTSLKLTAKRKPEKLWQRETIFILSIWSFKGLFSGTNSWLVLGTVSVCLLSYECYIMKLLLYHIHDLDSKSASVGGQIWQICLVSERFLFLLKRNGYSKTH